MKYLPQFPSILAIYCFCLLQHPSSGYIQPLDDSPDGLDIVQLEQLAYWATLSRQPKDNQDIYKRFLFDYSRTREPTQPVKIGFPPMRPVTRLAATFANGKMKRFLQRDLGAVALDFTKKVCKPCGEHNLPKKICERTGKHLELGHLGNPLAVNILSPGSRCYLGTTIFSIQAKEWKKH